MMNDRNPEMIQDFQEPGFRKVATEGSGISELAMRYARALFDLADERGILDETVQDVLSVKALLVESADLRRLVSSPLFTRVDQEKAMDAVLAAAGVGAFVAHFVGFVARNRRLFVLEGMIAAFLAQIANRRGERVAMVTAARPLSAQQQEGLAAALSAATGGRADMHIVVDPRLIGGLIVKIGSRMVDASVRAKLNKLKLAMKGVG
jgi:F-type H+-transporting ATPase subunit delta